MEMKIYNTLTRKKENFKPLETGKIKIYVCGPTVYDLCHVGHARSAVFFDVIVKYFRKIGFEVNYARNFTDIDDKIIDRSKKLGITYSKLSQFYINSFQQDMKSLNVDTPNAEPCVTNHISEIINLIQILIKNKSAYVNNGNVYFAVNTFPSYGKLSGRNKENMLIGSRVKINNDKNNPLDFAVWKSAKLGEPSWESPWGYGRPGWHIECSAMNNKLFGGQIDIHGGGEDLIFPHHENEIAQSESAYKVPLASYWMHNGLVNINNKKMSKSLGNWKSIKKMIKQYHPEAVRLFLLSNHYRKPINFSQHGIESCQKAIMKIHRAFQKIYHLIKIKKNINNGPLWTNFCNAMNDDFNTAKCIGILFNAIKRINSIIDNSAKKDDITQLNTLFNDILAISNTLGILNFLSKREHNLVSNNGKDIDPNYVNKLIAERKRARVNQNWERADSIRDQLNNMGIQIEDLPNGNIRKISN